MDTEAIIRQLKIDLITDQNTNPIILWFNDVWKNITIIERTAEVNYVFWNTKKDKLVFAQFDDRFWCDYDLYWKILYHTFDLNASLTRDITKLLVETKLNWTIPNPAYQVGLSNARMDLI